MATPLQLKKIDRRAAIACLVVITLVITISVYNVFIRTAPMRKFDRNISFANAIVKYYEDQGKLPSSEGEFVRWLKLRVPTFDLDVLNRMQVNWSVDDKELVTSGHALIISVEGDTEIAGDMNQFISRRIYPLQK